MGSLDGQIALVTGAGTGIVRAVADLFAREGACVALNGRRPEPLEETKGILAEAGGEGLVVPGDLTDDVSVERVAQTVRHQWGRIDVLVNNAGLNVPRRDLADLSADDWRSVIDADLTAPFLLCRAVLPSMRERRQGTIINIVASPPHRATIDEILIRPTVLRDVSEDRRRAEGSVVLRST